MADKNILHMITPLKHMSPFDVNMALDAGYDAVATYTTVTPGEVAGLVQDAIFSRPPKLAPRTGLFIAGRNATQALDMMDAAKKAMVPPFQLSVFADPAGSFTTAAAMVAVVRKVLREKKARPLKGLTVAVFGATGVVGYSSAVIAAQDGANVILVGYDGPDRVQKAAAEMEKRFGVKVGFEDGSTEELKAGIVKGAEVVFCAARAGQRVLSLDQLKAAPKLIAAADVNAVPPSGVEGLKVDADGSEIPGTHVLGVGALAVGGIKYRTEFGLFRKMIEAQKPVAYDFREAFSLAAELAG